MSDFKTTTLETVALDPYKRVRYSTGMVLGVDEFLQDQLYFQEKNWLHNRSLHGYGTVCGLDVSVREGADGPEIVVGPGLAVNPQGREIRVPLAQCAELNDWLASHREAVEASFGSPPSDLLLHLVLCCRECDTAEVPVPSGPCQTLEDTSVASRVADDFALELRLDPPEQVEEDTVRILGGLLRAIEITDVPGSFLTLDEFLDLVRELKPAGSPPESPPLESPPSSPPSGSPPELRVRPEDAPHFLRAGLLVWVTEVRPDLLPGGANCACGPPAEECVLLGRFGFPVEEQEGLLRVSGPVDLDEEARPYLLHTRLLQEWLMAGAGEWEGEGLEVHAELAELDADDHPQYLLADGSRALSGDLSAGGNSITDLAEAAAPGEAVPFQQAIKRQDPAGGDLRARYPNPRVRGLQGRRVAGAAPSVDEVLTWIGDRWAPRPLPTVGPGATVAEEGLTRIVALSWPHGGTNETPMSLEIDGNRTDALAVAFGQRELGEGEAVLVRRGSLDVDTFQLFAERRDPSGMLQVLRVPVLVRNVFPLDDIEIDPATGLIVRAVRTTSVRAFGAALEVQSDVMDQLLELLPLIRVLIRGDFVLDASGRAIDAEFVRGELPTGDRPSGSEVGIQGGTFESWARLRRQ